MVCGSCIKHSESAWCTRIECGSFISWKGKQKARDSAESCGIVSRRQRREGSTRVRLWVQG